jgi:hypothetical protein
VAGGITVIVAAAAFVLQSRWSVLLIAGMFLAVYLDYRRRMCRLTRKLVRLPIALGIRNYARWKDPQDIWDRFIGFASVSVLTRGVCIRVRRFNRLFSLFWLMMVFGLAWASLYSYVLWLRHRE